jgi:hypothetical protein
MYGPEGLLGAYQPAPAENFKRIARHFFARMLRRRSNWNAPHSPKRVIAEREHREVVSALRSLGKAADRLQPSGTKPEPKERKRVTAEDAIDAYWPPASASAAPPEPPASSQ